MEELGRKVLAGQLLDRTDAQSLVACEDLEELMAWAWRVRKARFANEVKFCSIGAGKVGACSEDCKWCAQSAHYSTHIASGVQRTDPQEMAKACRQAVEAGASGFGLVNSGRAPTETDLRLIGEMTRNIVADGAVVPCASLGELTDESARKLLAAGIRRYHHNVETSRRFYGKMVTTHPYDARLATLAIARKAGLTLCSGGLFGLGETWEDRLDLAFTLRDEVRPEITPLNFLSAIPGTPLSDAEWLTPNECLKIIAVFRLLLPEVDLKVAGGRGQNLRDCQSWMFYAGASSCMVGNYLTTIGRDAEADRQMVADLGLRLVDRFSFECDD